MENEILFSERQRWSIYLYILLGAVTLFVLFQVIRTFFIREELGSPGLSGGVTGLAVLLLVNIFVFSFRLDTQVKKDGIYVRMFPVHIKYRKYEWSDIAQVSVREYSPLSEYGGWGIRGWGDNKAFNMSGNKGMQLVFKDGRKLLIGTNKDEELKSVLALLSK